MYNVPSVEAEIFDNPLKLLGTNSILFPLAKSWTLKDEAVVVILDGAGSDYDYGKENETIFKMVRNSDNPEPEILYQSVVG